ncbi:hypothetical protein [Dyadobacter psychrotolerans]|uniref:Uncharacterized protein n=1 Tax=Dyadobacter psychrotolerans TaxID=2541721 RepID=A0A4R5DJS9_9BACT|nr:hypothetical protein [Dyadobacter psychrotolerans]TDE13617.1 hypothetical protein E0F88_17060 [Dyadobacter psychrotolerans]
MPSTTATRFILLSAISLVIYPAAASFFAEYLLGLFSERTVFNNYLGYQFTAENWRMTWSMLMVYDLWSYILLVQLPYSFIYRFSGLDKLHVIFKLAAFYVLLFSVKMLTPQSSIVSFFGSERYMEKSVLLLAITLVVCPVLIVVLDRFGGILKRQESIA